MISTDTLYNPSATMSYNGPSIKVITARLAQVALYSFISFLPAVNPVAEEANCITFCCPPLANVFLAFLACSLNWLLKLINCSSIPENGASLGSPIPFSIDWCLIAFKATYGP